jgi:antitoxin (DNA-binding transcriptional repressor) of toxin-antitoxin stability system
MTAMTLDEAQRNLPEVVQRALLGEIVSITVGDQTVRLVQDVPLRPVGYFTACYQDGEDAQFEERICQDSKPVVEE